MLGEPVHLNLSPDYLAPLGAYQKVNMAAFLTIYTLYVFLSLILLLNLLIALLGSSFHKTQQDSTLQGRIAFANTVLHPTSYILLLTSYICKGA